jgi:hypothetical protein
VPTNGVGQCVSAPTVALAMLGNWTHVAIQYTGGDVSTVQVFINGTVLVSAYPAVYPPSIGSAGIQLGMGSYANIYYYQTVHQMFFAGEIDNVNFYNASLSAVDIEELFAYGNVPPTPAPTQVPTAAPTDVPTGAPTTTHPTHAPSPSPTTLPTAAVVHVTVTPTAGPPTPAITTPPASTLSPTLVPVSLAPAASPSPGPEYAPPSTDTTVQLISSTSTTLPATLDTTANTPPTTGTPTAVVGNSAGAGGGGLAASVPVLILILVLVLVIGVAVVCAVVVRRGRTGSGESRQPEGPSSFENPMYDITTVTKAEGGDNSYEGAYADVPGAHDRNDDSGEYVSASL